jgi:3-oxoadipate enol-lactonase
VSGPVDVHHIVVGPSDAPTLVLSNSLGTTLAMWDPQVPAFAERFRLVRYDTRGHGRSPVPTPPYDIADLGADLLALLDRLEIERVSVCGLSLGGMTALWVAANAPDRVDRLVLCSTSARLGPPEAWAERAAAVRAGGMTAVADSVVRRWFTEAFAAREPEVVEGFRAMLRSQPADGYAAACGVVERMDLVPSLGAIRAPTLIIAGDDDPATPPEHARRIADGVAGARVVTVGASHLLNVEVEEQVTRAALDHLLVPTSEEER